MLPRDLPSSMHVGGKSNCSVCYGVHAGLHRPGVFRWDVSGNAVFGFRQGPQEVPVMPEFLEPSVVPVVVCGCCCNKGSMTLGARMDTTTVAQGGSVLTSFACKNNSTSELEAANIVISETIRFRGRSHHDSKSKQISMCRFGPEQIAGSDRLAAKLADDSQEDSMLVDASVLAVYRTLVESAEATASGAAEGAGCQTVVMPISSARTSYEGTLISVRRKTRRKVRT